MVSGRHVTDEERALACRLRRAGRSINAVAAILGRHKQTISQILHAAGVAPNRQRKQDSAAVQFRAPFVARYTARAAKRLPLFE